jgi:uncharacterized membrane protein
MSRPCIALLVLMLFCATAVLGRVGGGQSYSGGSSRSSGGSSRSYSGGGSSYSGGSSSSSYSGGGGGEPGTACGVIFFLVIVFLLVLILVQLKNRSRGPSFSTSPAADDLSALRRFDPNFSPVVFNDFCNALYVKAHHARGAGGLDRYALYMSD